MSGFRSLAISCLALAVTACAAGYTQPVTITVSPATVALETSATQSFTVVPSSGPVPTVVWTLAETGTTASIAADGTYVAPDHPGTFHVVATTPTGELTAQAEITVHTPANLEVAVSPSSVTLAAGQTQAFAATVTKSADTAVTWAVQETGGGTVDATGLYTAPQAGGVFHVVATAHADNTKTATATVTVTPPPAQVAVSITPTTTSILTGATASFSASVTGSSNSAVTWSVREASGGTVNASGLYTAPSAAGTFHVVATSVADTTKSASAAVTVTTPAISVSINPSAANVLTGATATYTATVTGTSNTGVTWSVQEAPGGSVSIAGLYLAPADPGTFHIVATSKADPTKSATATAIVSARPIVVVSVNPQTATAAAGGTVALLATVTGSIDLAVTWAVSEAGGGTVSAAGFYTAPIAAGTYHVVATSHADTTASATAAVTVTPVAVGLNLTTATVAQGATQAFACNVTGAVNTACTWSILEANGGTINAAGLYTAPTAPGTFHVVAKSSADPSKSASAAVTVPTVAVSINPTAASLLTLGTQLFTCAVTGSANPACTFSITEGASGGTIVAGAYVAPALAGVYHVVATSAADATKSATATVTVTAIAVSISPTSANVLTTATATFAATVTGTSNTGVTWSVQEAAGGSVSTTGVYTPPATAGTFHVVATSKADATKSATATAVVSLTPVVVVSVTPPTATVAAGGTAAFVAGVTGSTDLAVTWAVTEATGGSVSAAGLYTAPIAAGTYHVVATSHADTTKSATAVITVTPILVGVLPTTATVAQGATQAFVCTVTGAVNTACTWSVTEGAAGGSVSAAGLYTAPGAAGTFHVVAKSVADPTKSATATITVPAPSTIVVGVNPSTMTLSSGASFPFSHSITGTNTVDVTWSVDEPGGGTFNTTTFQYTAPGVGGTYHLRATSVADPTKSGFALITVTPPVIALSVSAATVSQGATQAFSCIVTNAANTGCTWSVTEAGGGTINAAGSYTAPFVPGPYHVVAKSNADPSKTATATVTVPNVSVAISPSSISLLAGGPKTFSCTVSGTITTGCTFSITEAGGGGLAAGGAYTAPITGGLYHVVATATADTTKTASAAITVSSPTVVITPKTASLIVGGQQTFGCTVSGAVDTACSWSVLETLGGLVGALTGIYVAPAITGTYHVTAQAHVNPAITDQATVTVLPLGSIPVVVTISPTSAALTPNQTQTFACNVTGSSNVACSFSVTESGGGVVTAAGVYTAPAAVGTYHVVTTSQADNTKSATASITVTSGNDAVMNFADLHQTIDGFGAASAFSVYNSMTDAQADHFFSTTAGIGLSLLRFQIDSDGGTADLVTAQKAQARGARVWATPWTPPAAWKSNGTIANGGTLLVAHYQDWANSLTNFVKNMKTNGVNVYAVSIQNEPDFVASYDSAQYNGAQFHDFIAVLGPTFAANAITAKIMLPETSNWDAMAGLSDPSLLDPNTAKYVGIAATHAYAGNVYHPYPNAQNQGIPLWETEVSDFNGFDSSIGSGINYATQIHNCMTVANCTAWHFWWFKATQGDNEGLQSSAGVDSYRYWAMGNFAKFVRPGFVRIGVTGGTSGISISAYRDPSTGNFAVVAINPSFSSATQRFVLSGASAPTVTPQITSSTFNLAAQASIDSSSGAFSMTLPAQSIITFTGTAH